jgi:hypothetical protein
MTGRRKLDEKLWLIEIQGGQEDRDARCVDQLGVPFGLSDKCAEPIAASTTLRFLYLDKAGTADGMESAITAGCDRFSVGL